MEITTRREVNAPYSRSTRKFPNFHPQDNSRGEIVGREWSRDAIRQAIDDNCLMSWGASSPMKASAIPFVRGDGAWLVDSNGKRYFDMSSQAVCSNLGHTMPQEIVSAIHAQMEELPMIFGDLGTLPIRGKMCATLADLFPGDLNGFMFPSSGAEAVEGAIRIARKYTGKMKIFTRYRSYHGGSLGALSATGDVRKVDVDTSTVGFVKMMDPFPQYFDWDSKTSGNTDHVRIQQSLEALHEQILNEGPNTCAAIMVESMTGGNGWLRTPPKYLQGLRALCDEYGMLLIADEVMAGFGRTGKWFAFQHASGVIPDVVTFAKGVTAGYLPLSGIGVRDKILKHFGEKPIGYGSTYQAHPVSLACAYATVNHMYDNGIVERAAEMESTISEMMQEILLNRHRRVKACRVTGMAGCVDIADASGENVICGFTEMTPETVQLKKNLHEEGVATIIRGHLVHVCPPLISSSDEIEFGLNALSRAITKTFPVG